LPLAGCAFVTALGAGVFALAGLDAALAVGLAADDLVAAFWAAAGFSVSAITMDPFKQLGRKKLSCYP
jgi:hypothetical protein